MLTRAFALLLYAKRTTQVVNGLHAHHRIAELSFHTLLFLWAPRENKREREK